MQEFIALYLIFLFSNSPRTIVQAPHPPSAQPSFVPVFFNSYIVFGAKYFLFLFLIVILLE